MATEMFKGASSAIFKRAEDLRERMTEAEKMLWEELRNKKIQFKFRRQHPLGPYVADFYCHKLKLVIELDGEIHLKEEVQRYDAQREAEIIQMGLYVIRFKNSEVLNSMDIVLQKIKAVAESIVKSAD